jgi:hypothetical protein
MESGRRKILGGLACFNIILALNRLYTSIRYTLHSDLFTEKIFNKFVLKAPRTNYLNELFATSISIGSIYNSHVL